jgi:hypothetical protein
MLLVIFLIDYAHVGLNVVRHGRRLPLPAVEEETDGMDGVKSTCGYDERSIPSSNLVEVGFDALHKLRLPEDVEAVDPSCGAGEHDLGHEGAQVGGVNDQDGDVLGW